MFRSALKTSALRAAKPRLASPRFLSTKTFNRPLAYKLYAIAAFSGLAVALGSTVNNEADAAKVEADKQAAEAKPEEEEGHQQAAFNPETGEINWDCPCLGGMAHGPCGEEFKEAFSCFVFSETEPKGIDCIKKFEGMRTCFKEHPEHYKEELYEDETKEELVDTAKETASDVVADVKETVSEAKEAASSTASEVAKSVEDTTAEVKQAAFGAKETASNTVAQAKETVSATVTEAKEVVASTAAEVKNTASEAIAQVEEAAADSADAAKDAVTKK